MGYDIINWPNCPVTGQGVWITERLKYNVLTDVRERDRKMIYPVAEKPASGRKKRDLIVSRVQELVPTARLVRYGGGVARLESDESTIEAYIGGYDASWRVEKSLARP